MPSPKGWKVVAMPEQLYERLRSLSVVQRKPIWRLISPYLPAMQREVLDAHLEELKVLQEKLKSGEALDKILARPDSFYTQLDGFIDLEAEKLEVAARKEIEEEAVKSEGGIDIWAKKESD